jgi:peptidyl-prolyl cis-trans isomerase SurA
VARDERLKISEQAASSKRRTDLGFKEDAVVRGKLLSLADSNLLKNKWKFGGTDETRKGVLFEAGGKTFTIGDFVIWLGKKKTSSTQSPKDYMNQLYNQFVNEKIDIAEEEKIVKENPDFSYLLSEYREGILLFEIMEKEIWNKASDDTVGQKKFYTEHLDKYKAGPRVEARIFSATDKAILDDTKKKIAQADTLTSADLKKFKSVQHFRNYERGESKVIDKINWVPGVQETELDGVYYLVEVVRLVEAGTKKFGDARAQVISGYQDTLEKNWVESLRKKYPVKVNTKNKNAIVQELIKK